MKIVYFIFSVVGWAWFVVFMGYIAWRVRADRRQSGRQGFEVVRHDAK